MPLIANLRSGTPILQGCGIKFALAGRRFLLTAAHVVDELAKRPLYYSVEENWVQITGISVKTDPPGLGKRDDDRTDAAVIHLDREAADRLPAPFVVPETLDVNERQAEGRSYLILGYPHNALKKDYEERRLTPRAMSYASRSAGAAQYEQAGVPSYSHIVLPFDREQLLGSAGLTAAPKPNGMSGCGVWRFRSLMRPGEIEQDKLVAVFTEHLPRAGRVLVATKVGVHVEMMRQKWPDLNDRLPRTRLMRCRLVESDVPERVDPESAT